jgi:hypothetical protein
MKSNPEELKLPDIALSDLPESTKDFLIASSGNAGKPVVQVIRDTLTKAAERAGFPPAKPNHHAA